jgi:hypothetical protein
VGPVEAELESAGSAGAARGRPEAGPLIVACTVPFPGCLAGALAAARSAKARFGDRVRTDRGRRLRQHRTPLHPLPPLLLRLLRLPILRSRLRLPQAILEAEGSSPIKARAERSGRKRRCRGGRSTRRCSAIRRPEPSSARRRLRGRCGLRRAAVYAETDATSAVRYFPITGPSIFPATSGRWTTPIPCIGSGRPPVAQGLPRARLLLARLRLLRREARLHPRLRPRDVDALFAHLVAQSAATGVAACTS